MFDKNAKVQIVHVRSQHHGYGMDSEVQQSYIMLETKNGLPTMKCKFLSGFPGNSSELFRSVQFSLILLKSQNSAGANTSDTMVSS